MTPGELLDKMRDQLKDTDCPGSYCPPKYGSEFTGRYGAMAVCMVCGGGWKLQPNEVMRRHPRERRHYARS